MFALQMPIDGDETVFRDAARRCLALELSPAEVTFGAGDAPSLFPAPPPPSRALSFSVPRQFADLMHDAACHTASDRFALLYDVLWRITHGARDLAANPADSAVARLGDYARAVRRDIYKMHAFVRFRSREIDGRTVFVAWFEPQHFVLRRAVPFFVDRFAGMEWMIATPQGTACWDSEKLTFGPAPAAAPTHEDDPVLDEIWTTYYRTTFNPARLRVDAMFSEMPRHFWANMPETAQVPDLIAQARRRVDAMGARPPDRPPRFAERIGPRDAAEIDANDTLARLRAEIGQCRRCPLHGPATQAVCGEGPEHPSLVFVGEQPGDQEDLAGKPFIGPAGELFNRALAEARIDRAGVYVTNAVKHFKYEPRGKRRIHKRPNAGEVQACRWWLDRELSILAPRLVVALGGTAAGALAGRSVSVLRERGFAQFGPLAGYVTVHPSFMLRVPDEASRAKEYAAFVADLRRIREGI
jgi:DNA polymerase